MAEPYEILASPFAVYLAPVATAFPDVDTDPAGAWEELGTSGADDQGDDGVTVEHTQSINVFRGGKATGPIKVWRTEEGLRIAFTLHDVTTETLAKALNDATVTDTPPGAGTPGTRSITLRRGVTVATHALLARSLSGGPYGDDLPMQYQVPKVYLAGNPSTQYRKGNPAGTLFEFMALEDLTATTEEERFGQLVEQDALASS